MRLFIIIRYIGSILLFNAIFLAISLLISVFHQENSTIPILYTMLICILFGLFPLIFVPPVADINNREGLTIVVFGWIITCIIGALPYIMWGGEFSLINAWFESVSGYTTTGSSILTNIEALPMGLLFWRSSTHFIGGIGIILFSLLILPESVNTRLVLFNTEMSELAKNNFKYRAKQTIQILAVVYIGLTILETILLSVAGMSLFDAVNHTFATIATGGFSTKNNSIAYFNSVPIEIIITIFMVISGIHFGLLFDTIALKKFNIFKSTIVRFYILFMALGTLFVSLKLYFDGYGSFPWALRYASFQIASVGTTTGFATIDTGNWPYFAHMILIYFTIQCACVGSTSGGLKFDRVFVFFKMIGKQVKNILHPRAIFLTKIDNRVISEGVENHTSIFIILYLLIILVSTTLVSLMNVDLQTAFSGAITTIGNVGPGLGRVSSLSNFNGLPDMAKLVYSVDMLLGRLEIFSIITLFVIKR